MLAGCVRCSRTFTRHKRIARPDRVMDQAVGAAADAPRFASSGRRGEARPQMHVQGPTDDLAG